MIRREIPLPVAIGVIVLVLLVAVAILWRQTSTPKESVLKSWAPYPQIPSQQGAAPQSPR
ncbi:MAG: hypothetical protein NZ749_06440 [bacterium]|nr:hypothetical protein [bacterium]